MQAFRWGEDGRTKAIYCLELLSTFLTSLAMHPQRLSTGFRSGEHAGWSKRVMLFSWKKYLVLQKYYMYESSRATASTSRSNHEILPAADLYWEVDETSIGFLLFLFRNIGNSLSSVDADLRFFTVCFLRMKYLQICFWKMLNFVVFWHHAHFVMALTLAFLHGKKKVLLLLEEPRKVQEWWKQIHTDIYWLQGL